MGPMTKVWLVVFFAVYAVTAAVKNLNEKNFDEFALKDEVRLFDYRN